MRAGHEARTDAAGDAALMRAVTQDRYGTSDVLHVTELPRPSVDRHQVLVRVHAAGLDRGTQHLMTGQPYAMRLAFGLRRPKNPIPGRDVAGIVVSVGADVTRFAPGDAVYGVAPGSFAEYAVTTPEKLAPKPANLTFAEAAVVPVSAGTALQAVTEAGKVNPGQSVLITGASGGVGSYAVQIARTLGAHVTGVCSTGKLDYVSGLGAHHAVDYTATDWTDGTRRFDVILDIAGNPSLRRLRRALAPDGTVVFVGGEQSGSLTGMSRQVRGALISLFVSQRLVLFLARERAADYEHLTRLIESGQLLPTLDRTWPLAQAPEAMQLMERGGIRGKVAITA